ncbi:MAG: type II toxin-antitoxin system prevent-host-death family antitoxin [Spirochaetales bacterium]|jgi:prevent-host-death family protein|nr:type II toxin-antitoxin system prevent-host-death family antitoxin [Spirochaetales bacterium]
METYMEVTTKQLRSQPGRIISQVNNGQEITITYRGKAFAKIVPCKKESSKQSANPENELFGMWKNRDDINDVDRYVRNIRKGRDVC